MTDQTTDQPGAPRRSPPVPNPPRPRTVPARPKSDKPVIPPALLMGMIALILAALSLATFARLTDRPLVGVPHAAPVVAERSIVLDGDRSGSVTVRDPGGAVILADDAPLAGFVSAIWRGLDRKRGIHQVAGNPPVTLTEYANGRLSVSDPETGWSAELGSFGDTNRAAFARLLD